MRLQVFFPWLATFFCAALFTSCVKDSAKMNYTLYSPVYQTSEQVRANIKSVAPVTVFHSGKMYLSGNYLFMNELYKGVHIIDISNPSNPQNKAFINIPGNEDIAVLGNTLYADCYTDLMAIDITNPLDSKLLNYVANIFPDRRYVGGFYADSGKVMVDWTKRDTILETQIASKMVKNNIYYSTATDETFANYISSSVAATPSANGQGGSMARFAIQNPYLYTVTTSKLNVVNITQPQVPKWTRTVDLGFSIETIFPYQDKLFIGSNNGVQVLSVSAPESPSKLGSMAHVRTCDPVIFDGKYAFVTLRGGTACGGYTNQLDVLDAADPTAPTLLKSYPLTGPYGLTKDGDALFVCDGTDGLKYFDASDVDNITLQSKINVDMPYDVIHYNKMLLVSAKDGLYIYDYSNLSNIQLKNKIGFMQP